MALYDSDQPELASRACSTFRLNGTCKQTSGISTHDQEEEEEEEVVVVVAHVRCPHVS